MELELGCAVESPTASTQAWAGVRLRLKGPAQPHPDGTERPLDLLTLLQLPEGADGEVGCLGRGAMSPETGHRVVDESGRLASGRFLDVRLPLGPLLEEQGFDPLVARVATYDVVLDVAATPGSGAWVEVGRVLSDSCP